MKIFIYGDSNTFGQIPNINGYSKDAIIEQYPAKNMWWFPLTREHDVVVNGLSGRAIANDNPWLENRNASKTIESEILGISADLAIIALGTNDCKNRYNLSPTEIAEQLEVLASFIKEKTGAKILIISPAQIKEGNKITDKFYVGAEKKSQELEQTYYLIAKKNGFEFVSATNLSVGEDGEHLTAYAHKILGQRVLTSIQKMLDSQNQKQ